MPGSRGQNAVLYAARRGLYRSFRRLYRWSIYLQKRFTPSGGFFVSLTLAAAIFGLDTERSFTYQAFTFAAALWLIAVAGLAARRPALVVERELPPCATAGTPFSYRLRVRNRGPRHAQDLEIHDEPEASLPSFEEFSAARDPEDERRNFFDRAVGYPRWLKLLAERRPAATTSHPLPALPPGGEADLRIEVTPRRRGVLRFTAAEVSRPEPLGLLRRIRREPAPGTLPILPRRYPVSLPRWGGASRRCDHGQQLALGVGESEEFLSLRDYRPGDPLRRVHWRMSARTGRLAVREFQDEHFVRYGLILDTFAAAPAGAEFEEAVSLAASYATLLPARDVLMELLFVGPEAYLFTAGRGVGQARGLLEILAGVAPCPDRPFRVLADHVLRRLDLMSGCVAVFQSLDAERSELASRILEAGVPLEAFVLLPPEAERPAPSGPFRWLRAGHIAEDLAS